MPEKARGIPFIGRQGLLALLGAVFGVFASKFLFDNLPIPGKGVRVVGGMWANELVELAIPVACLLFLKRFKAFFVGWIIGWIVMEVYEWIYGIGGYTAPSVSGG